MLVSWLRFMGLEDGKSEEGERTNKCLAVFWGWLVAQVSTIFK
jgi:hypothetical protein